MSTNKFNSMATFTEIIIMAEQVFIASQFLFHYIAQQYNADGAKQEGGVPRNLSN